MSRIEELQNLILANTANYYEGRDCVSDAEFDSWIDELRSIDPNNHLLHTVGWGYDLNKSSGKKFKHLNYLSGIDNKPKVAKDAQLPGGRIKTPKMDGGSVELQYYKGVFQRSLTRGDGTYGLDCTAKLQYIVPHKLKVPYTGNIVGEYVISSQDLEGFSDSISQRNIPNGFLGRDYASEEDCKRFSFVAYKIGMSKTHKFSSRVAILEFIRSLGFLTVDYIVGSGVYQELIDRLQVIGGKNYLLDGIVSSSEIIHQNEDGTIIYPDELAYKTITATAKPLVKRIDWNLTRTGKLIPTVVTDTITLSGANINRFLAHNAEYVNDNGIGIGARLEVTRSGEVIPYILDIIDPVTPDLPKVCPSCGSELSWKGVHLVCTNTECSGQSYSRIHRWISVLASVDNLGSALISSLVEAFEINSIPDLYKDYDLSILRNFDGVGESKIKVVEEMFNQLKSSHSLEAYLLALNISGLGYQSAKRICHSTNILEELKDSYYSDEFEDQVLRIKGVNYPTKISLLKNWGKLVDLFPYMNIAESTPSEQDSEANSDKIKVCITGKLNSLTKSKFYQAHSDKIVESSVKDCDYLISNSDEDSSKHKAAVKLGKKIVTEDEFLSIIQEV